MELLKRYDGQRTYTDGKGNTVSGRYKRVDKDLTSIEIVTEKITTLDILAMKHYGTPLLFWLIADYNDISDPMIDIPAGTTLKIPVVS